MAERKDKTKITEAQGGGGGWFRGFKSKPHKDASGKHPKTEQGKLTDSQYKGQQKYIENLKTGKGSTGGRTGIVERSKSLKDQKVKKRKREKLTMEQDAQKQRELRDKQFKMEAEGRQHIKEQTNQRELYGDWLPTSKGAVRKRLESTKFFSKLKSNTKKNKEGKQETYTPPPIEGIPRPKKR